MDKQQAVTDISVLLQTAQDCMNAAVRISEESGVEFHLPWGSERGDCSIKRAGASYYPTNHPEIDGQLFWDGISQGWNPSAGSC